MPLAIEECQRSSRIARAMGFDGKQCIHPAQLAAVNEIFTPTAAEVAHAERVAQAAAGRGAATLDGKMIDAANIRMAEALLAQWREIQERVACESLAAKRIEKWLGMLMNYWVTNGRTMPVNVISPVIATCSSTGRSVYNEASAVAIVTPADGPSLGVAPAGTCR